jgi:hypothetical protein
MMARRRAVFVSVLLFGVACPGPSEMSVQGIALVPDAAIAAAVPGKRYAVFTTYKRDGWMQARVPEYTTVLCAEVIARDIPFWIHFAEGCGAPGEVTVVLQEIAPTRVDPCLSTVMGVRPDLKPQGGIKPAGTPLASATVRVFEDQSPKCGEYGDDRRDDVGMVMLTR